MSADWSYGGRDARIQNRVFDVPKTLPINHLYLDLENGLSEHDATQSEDITCHNERNSETSAKTIIVTWVE